MSKRVADKYITDQNWDMEEEEDEANGPGEFRKADADILKSRVIRKARRKIRGSEGGGMSAFSGFTGLNAPTKGSGFKGFNLSSGVSKAKSLTLHKDEDETYTTPQESGEDETKTLGLVTIGNKRRLSQTTDEEQSGTTKYEYNRHLIALNKSVSDWIKSHVEKDPLCDLTPIFKDYQRHLKDIEDKYGYSDTESSQLSATTDSQEVTSSSSSSQSVVQSSSDEKAKFNLIGFVASSDKYNDSKELTTKSSSVAKPDFSTFSSPSTSGSPFKGFGNVGNASKSAFSGFSFSSNMVCNSGSSDGAAKQSGGQDEEEYVPPKAESNVVVEEDAFYTIRCKLYYKKDDGYADKGVGQLYLKPSGSKTQLLIRADTAISQVLLNILLASSIPVQRQGKNNVLIMCMSNPPINDKEGDKVTPMLIRVKNAEDADKLFEIIQQKKKEAEDC